MRDDTKMASFKQDLFPKEAHVDASEGRKYISSSVATNSQKSVRVLGLHAWFSAGLERMVRQHLYSQTFDSKSCVVQAQLVCLGLVWSRYPIPVNPNPKVAGITFRGHHDLIILPISIPMYPSTTRVFQARVELLLWAWWVGTHVDNLPRETCRVVTKSNPASPRSSRTYKPRTAKGRDKEFLPLI